MATQEHHISYVFKTSDSILLLWSSTRTVTVIQVHVIFVDEKFHEDLLRQHVFSPDIVSVIYFRGKKKQPVFKKNFFNRISEIERDHN